MAPGTAAAARSRRGHERGAARGSAATARPRAELHPRARAAAAARGNPELNPQQGLRFRSLHGNRSRKRGRAHLRISVPLSRRN